MTVEPMLRDKLIESLRQNPDMSPQELAKKHDANLSYCYTVKSKWEKNKKPFETEKTVTSPEKPTPKAPASETDPISVEVTEVLKPEAQVQTEEPSVKLPEGVKKALLEGELSPEDISSVFQALNQMFPIQHQRPDKAMMVLGKLWYRPANKILEEYSDKNPLLVIAVLMTFVTFAPNIKGVFDDWKKSKEKSKQNEVKQK
jgi:hypothetical protein